MITLIYVVHFKTPKDTLHENKQIKAYRLVATSLSEQVTLQGRFKITQGSILSSVLLSCEYYTSVQLVSLSFSAFLS